MNRDRRPGILRSALFSPDLSYAERLFLIVACTIATEYVDGKRRHGSKAMDHSGRFSLHTDYLAGALNTTAEGVRKLRLRLENDGALSLVHPGTFGRPSMWQALDVRADKNGEVTSRPEVHPYGFADWFVRADFLSTLTYRTPDHRNPAPTSGASPQVPAEVLAATQEQCRWHGFAPCPEDCADHRNTRRETA